MRELREKDSKREREIQFEVCKFEMLNINDLKLILEACTNRTKMKAIVGWCVQNVHDNLVDIFRKKNIYMAARPQPFSIDKT